MKIQIPLEITLKEFEAVIVTALEGGSNYWYFLPDQPNLDFGDWLKDEPLAIKIARKLFDDKNYHLIVNDAENEDETLGKITQASLIEALVKCPKETLDIINEDYDGDTTDVIFQTAVMGEVIYG